MLPRKTLEPGANLGRYELMTMVGQGGMASVWAARQSGLHGFRKTVAIKTILPALTDDPQFERMFLAEARLAMRVHHPNVAEILDLGEDDNVLYLAMEWIDGDSLSVLLKTVEAAGASIPRRLCVYIAVKACLGLHAAHEVTDDDDRPVGIVHRDVSPQNLMVTYDGHVKVVDFGVAKGHSEGGATQTGQLKGKVPYMAPEQVAGAKVDRRADIFAMGTLLYRLTTGAHPFSGGNPVLTMHNIIQRQPTSIAQLDPAFPPSLEAIIMCCLAKAPEDRYATMVELAHDLEQVLVELGPPVTEQELATFVKTHLGGLRMQRRASMRDAARALGWAVATSESLPRVTLPHGPHSLTPTGTSGVLSAPRSVTPAGAAATVLSRPPAGKGLVRRAGLIGLVALAAFAGVMLVRTLAKPKGGASAAASAPVAAAPTETISPRPIETATPIAPSEAPAVAPAPQPTPTSAPVTAPARPRVPGPLVRPGTKEPKPGTWQQGPDMGF